MNVAPGEPLERRPLGASRNPALPLLCAQRAESKRTAASRTGEESPGHRRPARGCRREQRPAPSCRRDEASAPLQGRNDGGPRVRSGGPAADASAPIRASCRKSLMQIKAPTASMSSATYFKGMRPGHDQEPKRRLQLMGDGRRRREEGSTHHSGPCVPVRAAPRLPHVGTSRDPDCRLAVAPRRPHARRTHLPGCAAVPRLWVSNRSWRE